MISYELFKVIHIVSVIVFLTATAITFFSTAQKVTFKILAGLSTFIIFFSGLILLIKLSQGVPGWAMGKFVIWLVVSAMGAIVAKRVKGFRLSAYGALIILASGAIFLAVVKPF